MPAVNICESRKAIQWTGSNAAEIDAAITDLTIDSNVGGVLTVTSSSTQFVLNTGDWATYWQGYINGIYTNAQFNFYFLANAITSDMTSMQTQVNTNTTAISSNSSAITALQAAMSTLGTAAVRSAGVQTAPTLLLGVAQNVDVTLLPAMPNTSYTPYSFAFGGVNLSGLTINSTTVINASTVRVNLQTSLVSLAGVHVMVLVKS